MTAFATPREAVDVLSTLLASRDWAGLAACYDADPATLPPGFFYDEDAQGHPAGFDRWRHPFPPGWRYESHEERGDLAVVRVSIEIDEGDGMVQRGVREFRMRRSPAGWKVLPPVEL